MSRSPAGALPARRIATVLLALTALSVTGFDLGARPALAGDAATTVTRQPVVRQLETLLLERPNLETAFEEALPSAAFDGLATPEEFFAFSDELLTRVPVERELVAVPWSLPSSR